MASAIIELLGDPARCPEKVTLSSMKVNDDMCKKIADILQLNKKIRSLYLDGNVITSKGAAALGDALKSNTTLEFLNVSKNQITYEGARLLFASLKVNRSLRGVDFSFNDLHVPTESTPSVSPSPAGRGPHHDFYVMFPFNKTLQYLNLSNTKLSTPLVQRILEGVAVNKSLQWLDLSQNDLTDAIAEYLGRCMFPLVPFVFNFVFWVTYVQPEEFGHCIFFWTTNRLAA
jgi:NLR family CARD domain-containing protein 3